MCIQLDLEILLEGISLITSMDFMEVDGKLVHGGSYLYLGI
jgi:hypothetical protein